MFDVVLTLLLFLTAAGSACAAVLCVDANSANPTAPYTNWASAAATIQEAVDAAAPGDEIVVTDGVYATGGRVGNRVALDRPVTMRSVNGPLLTVIKGGNAGRCVYLTNGASLSGFTLTNGVADTGGGVWCESINSVVSNCIVTGNSAVYGGGAYGGTLNNCTLSGNLAYWAGGGAYGGTLNNCTLTGNSAPPGGMSGPATGGGACACRLNNCTLTGNSAGDSGGGAAYGTLNNCIVYFNTATSEANYNQGVYGSVLNYCCTTPQPTNGFGNITNEPLFVDYAGGNLRLQSNSPCINAGSNAYVTNSTDLDGRPRIVSGTVDIGAYEFQLGASGLFIAWLQHYGLPTDGSADATDPDADGLNNWQEWRCQTDPTNALSVLRLLSASSDGTNVNVSWQSVAGVNYFLERSTDLAATPPFTLLAPNLPGQPGTNTFTDTNTVALPRLFYRVGVGD